MSGGVREPWDEIVRRKLAKDRWRGVGELLNDPAFREAALGEFPEGADAAPDAVSRRGLLRLLGASMALAGVTGCTRAVREKIVPYAHEAPEVTPGVAARYATAMAIDGYAVGLVVESHEGRPTKIEGNPLHPMSLGAASVYHQASLLGLYDPDRARAIRAHGEPHSWETFAARARDVGEGGAGVWFLLEPTSSPHVADAIQSVRTKLPKARFCFFSPVDRRCVWGGAALARGRALEPRYDLHQADVVVALDADFLCAGPTSLRDARAFADRRRVRARTDTMNRLYAVEPAPSVTGMTADHRLRVRALDVPHVAAALLAAVAKASGGAPIADRLGGVPRPDAQAAWLDAVAKDLAGHRGRSAVLAGDAQPKEVHALVHAMNELLGNVGGPVEYGESPVLEAGEDSHALDALVAALDAGEVDLLVVLDGNPLYAAPSDLELVRRFHRAKEVVVLAAYENETAEVATWFLPAAHYLESWGDARAQDGTVSIVQPLVTPLWGGRTPAEVLWAFAGDAGTAPLEALRRTWQRSRPDAMARWERTLAHGVMEGTDLPAVSAPLRWDAVAHALDALPPAPPPGVLEVAFRPDRSVYDGRFANNPWLQELPDPATKLTWDNAALLSPKTAARLGVETGDVVRLAAGPRSLAAPVLVQPGHADDSVSLALGYGRRSRAEANAEGVGADASGLRTSDAPSAIPGVSVVKTGVKRDLAVTQTHWSMEGRDAALHGTLEQYARDPKRVTRDANKRPLTLYENKPGNGGQQWGMVIDLAACTGCSACVVACQAENNVPVVGRDGVLKSREMHWLRIDRYFSGDVEDPDVLVQPMLCQHCEMAPCEYVCPVHATTHSDDGLNEMTYNRCVGTRFCSNNCPYKVRRFNWFNYNQDKAPSLQLAMNPDVTVRARGVMEKCSYCVQRIREAEIAARREDRPIADGEVKTACQQTCPTGAIVFGNIADPASAVSRLKDDDRTYAVLHNLGTVPHTRYMARLSNPNPDIDPERGGTEG